MKKNIDNVCRYYQPYIKDCFSNAVSSLLMFKKLDPDLLFTEYLSFVYEQTTGFCGVNYLSKPLSTKEFSAREANCSYEFCQIIVRRNSKQQILKTDSHKLHISINLESDPLKAMDIVKQHIDDGEPVAVGVDLYYIPYHQAFNREHGLHYVVVTGYDDNEGKVIVSDYYPLANCDFQGYISFADLEQARNSDFPQFNPVIGHFKRPIMNRWVEIERQAQIEISEKRVKQIIMTSLNRMAGRENPLPYNYGFPALAAFREDILRKKDNLNEVNTFLFRKYYNETFKIIARSRRHFQVFISSQSYFKSTARFAEIDTALTNSSRSWDICANLSYKLAVSKRMEIIDSMVFQLDAATRFEENLCNILADLIETMV